jgi:hypothetical protein
MVQHIKETEKTAMSDPRDFLYCSLDQGQVCSSRLNMDQFRRVVTAYSKGSFVSGAN